MKIQIYFVFFTILSFKFACVFFICYQRKGLFQNLFVPISLVGKMESLLSFFHPWEESSIKEQFLVTSALSAAQLKLLIYPILLQWWASLFGSITNCLVLLIYIKVLWFTIVVKVVLYSIYHFNPYIISTHTHIFLQLHSIQLCMYSTTSSSMQVQQNFWVVLCWENAAAAKIELSLG